MSQFRVRPNRRQSARRKLERRTTAMRFIRLRSPACRTPVFFGVEEGAYERQREERNPEWGRREVWSRCSNLRTRRRWKTDDLQHGW